MKVQKFLKCRTEY